MPCNGIGGRLALKSLCSRVERREVTVSDLPNVRTLASKICGTKEKKCSVELTILNKGTTHISLTTIKDAFRVVAYLPYSPIVWIQKL